MKGYDIQDAIVMNKSSLERGFGRAIAFRRYLSAVKEYQNSTNDKILAPPAYNLKRKGRKIPPVITFSF